MAEKKMSRMEAIIRGLCEKIDVKRRSRMINLMLQTADANADEDIDSLKNQIYEAEAVLVKGKDAEGKDVKPQDQLNKICDLKSQLKAQILSKEYIADIKKDLEEPVEVDVEE